MSKFPSSNHISIPDARDLLRELADKHGISELRTLANLMYRRKHKAMRAPNTSQTVTPHLNADIRRFHRQNPVASNQDIANHFGVNPGRISEALESV